MAVEGFKRSGGLNRREFLSSGSLGCAALAATAVHAETGALPATARFRSHQARSVILFWLDGGVSPYETFAPAAPETGHPGLFGAIPSKADGVPVSALMPRMAGWMDRALLIRAVHHTDGTHAGAARWMQTGKAAGVDHAQLTMGERIAYGLGSPAGSAAHLADTLRAGSSPAAPHLASSEAAAAAARVDWAPSSRPSRGDRRRTLLTRIDPPLVAHSAVRHPERASDYGDSPFGRDCLEALRRVEAGAPFVQVTLSGWDCHANLADSYRSLVPQLDQGLSALLADLEDRGMLRETLVVCMSEFGRSPRLNSLGGRDHWPYAGCAVLAGSGIPAGRAFGSVGADGLPDGDAVSPAELLLSIYDWVGVDGDGSEGLKV